MYLPKDPVMLLSMINMKLRDEFDSLDTLACEAGVDKSYIIQMLENIGYHYNSGCNQFK